MKLLPCPHCGGEPTYESGKSEDTPIGPGDYYEHLYCNNEACVALYDEDAKAWWNTRVVDPKDYERLKRVHDKLQQVIECLRPDYEAYDLTPTDLAIYHTLMRLTK